MKEEERQVESREMSYIVLKDFDVNYAEGSDPNQQGQTT